jgi:hypothetical protein
MPVQLSPAEEVGESVLDSRPVAGPNGEVVAQGDAVELAQEAGEGWAASRLTVDDVYIGAVVDVEHQ